MLQSQAPWAINDDDMTSKEAEHDCMEQQVRALLHQQGLRVTAPCLAVLRVLSRSETPLSHTEVLDHIVELQCDPATVYRNLVKLRDAGLACVASRINGVDRYVFAMSGAEEHVHPHFYCTECKRISCLPAETKALVNVKGPWRESVQQAVCDLRGTCPSCREQLK